MQNQITFKPCKASELAKTIEAIKVEWLAVETIIINTLPKQ